MTNIHMGLLDIYNISLTQISGYYQRTLNALDPDLTTIYPNTVTGTPTNTQNPGAPPLKFDQQYDSGDTYLNTLTTLDPSVLKDTLNITNLDVENSGVQGGPNNDITTQYPASVTGTPTVLSNPGGAAQNFNQPYTPSNTYLNANYNVSVNNTVLFSSLKITNLDVEDPGVQGGIPYSTLTDPTQYPSTITGTPNATQNPGGPVKKFKHPYNPTKTYLDNITTGSLQNTLNITNLDVEDPGVQGGPNADTTTVYPSIVTGTPTSLQNPGGPPQNFDHSYSPSNTYIDSITTGSLQNTLNITNLDVEDPGVQGGPKADTITNFSPWVTGTPTYTQNPGGAPQRFVQKWAPNKQYAANNPVAGDNSGILYNIDLNKDNSLKITNLDTSNPGVQGGIPYNQLLDPTSYPPTVNHTSPIKGWFAEPSSPPSKFTQIYNSNYTYSDFIDYYS